MDQNHNSKYNARDRIIKTAYDLFYRQGYHQTGINQIIDEAGVAKATFYNNFRSKEELCTEYLRERDRIELKVMQSIVGNNTEPVDKYMAIVKGLITHMEDSRFRGCGFNNMAIEITSPDNPIRKEVKIHNDSVRKVLRNIVKELKTSDKRYSHISVEDITDTYYLIVEGAIAASQQYNDSWPLKLAVKAVRKLIEK